MDSLPPTTTRSEPLHPAPGAITSADDAREDPGFGAELTRQLREERRTSSPTRAAETTGDEPKPQQEDGTELTAAHDLDGAPSADGDGPSLPASAGDGSISSWSGAALGLERSISASGALFAATPEATAAQPSVAGATSEEAEATSKPMFAAAVERATEEQINLRKLARYLSAQTPASGGEKSRAEPAPQTQAAPELEADRTQAPAASAPEPEPEPEPEPRRLEPTSSAPSRAEGARDLAASAGKLVGSDGSELTRPFDPGAPVQVTTTPEPEVAARQQQLRAATQRALAEARQRLLEPGRLQDGRLAVTLDVREATIPMRLRFSPDGQGGQNVAFLVSTAKDLRELKRLMPEIETVLTELPVEVSDVNVDVDSFRDTPKGRARGDRP